MADFHFKDWLEKFEFWCLRIALVFITLSSLLGFVEYKTGVFAKLAQLLGW
jgi:hypothetical protein